ncbi:TcfC E-set like domain-containing protein [Providencia hangzhouensis]|uniref:TcfC E-set like domain-containing protein n=1 Tax=Providencia hangzhouensis TaxID=3031799 RepID=UPI0034DCF819
MGSFEVDTSILPFGIYDVTIETVVDGKIVTTQHQTINKSFGEEVSILTNSTGRFTGDMLILIRSVM